MGARQIWIWQLCLWLAANSEAMAWMFSKAFGHILTHRKYAIPPKLQAFNYRKASPFPSIEMVLQSGCLWLCCFPAAYLLCIAVFLSSTTHNSMRTVSLVTGGWKTWMPFCSEQHQYCFLCMHVPSFLLAAVWKLLFSAQGLYHYPPNHSRFTGFQKSSLFPAYIAKKSIFLDSLTAVLISTPCSICCWAMQRGRWAALVCPEAQKGCACALALMSCVWSLCSRSTKVLPELQPLVQRY